MNKPFHNSAAFLSLFRLSLAVYLPLNIFVTKGRDMTLMPKPLFSKLLSPRARRIRGVLIRGFLYALPCAVILALLGGCSTTQLTSGAAYNSRPVPLSQFKSIAPHDLNAEIRAIADIEPNLEFPARIGFAKIEHNKLQPVPLKDLNIWEEARDSLPFAAGAFIPLSPLITASVSKDLESRPRNAKDLLANIRRGSARQHLDYVLIYDITHYNAKTRNLLSAADISILGLFALPSRDIKVETSASAILMDVRSGYPYGTASAFKEAGRMSTSYRSDSAQNTIKAQNSYEATRLLAQDVADMFIKLNRINNPASYEE